MEYLRDGTLQAIVCHPLTRERMPISPEVWQHAWFPERPLVADAIRGDEGENGAGGFQPYADRTPFVSERELSAVLGGNASSKGSAAVRAQYLWDRCRKAFIERVEEHGAPTIEGGEEGWRTQADVERWIIGYMGDNGGKEPGSSTARRYARIWMANI